MNKVSLSIFSFFFHFHVHLSTKHCFPLSLFSNTLVAVFARSQTVIKFWSDRTLQLNKTLFSVETNSVNPNARGGHIRLHAYLKLVYMESNLLVKFDIDSDLLGKFTCCDKKSEISFKNNRHKSGKYFGRQKRIYYGYSRPMSLVGFSSQRQIQRALARFWILVRSHRVAMWRVWPVISVLDFP